MQRKMIIIRSDANEVIGTGHIMRCLSIAYQIEKLNEKVLFVVADEKAKRLVENRGFSAICLDTKWDSLDDEIEHFCKIIRDYNVLKILVDSYYITEKYLKRLKEKNVTVYYLDDIGLISKNIDFLINYNIYADIYNYPQQFKKRLLGPMYTPLREEFREIHVRNFKGIRRIMITSGGTDSYNVLDTILDRLLSIKKYKDLEFFCILGCFNDNEEILKSKYGKNKNVVMLKNVKNISCYMKNSDVAITAAGSTVYELCACGVPSILYTIADNQLNAAKAFSKRKIISWAGDFRNDIEECLRRMIYELNQLDSANYWEEKSKSMQKLVDGNGAYRIAREMV